MRQMCAMKQRQGGLTLISWLVVIAMAGFAAMFVIRLMPIYMEHFDVKSSLTSLVTDPELRGGTIDLIRDHLLKRLEMNDANDVTSDDITITPSDTGSQVNITYDVKTPFVYNISLMVHFDDTVEVPR